MTLRSKGQRLSNGADRGEFALYSFLERDEYARLCAEQGTLRDEIKNINRQMSSKKGEDRASLKRQAQALITQWEKINEILIASERGRRAVIAERYARMSAMDFVESIKAAKLLIEQLQERLGDEWTEEQRDICTVLRHLTLPSSPLLDMVSRSDSDAKRDALQEQYTKDLATERAASQLAVSQLKGQLRDLQGKRSRAADVLARLYAERYEEVDAFRRGRGVTHRIHLTDDDCKAIEEALQ